MSTYVIAEVVGRDKERYAAPSPRNMKSPSQRVEVPARAKFAGQFASWLSGEAGAEYLKPVPNDYLQPAQ
jgi:hypothetical protein